MGVSYYACNNCGDARYEEAIIRCECCGQNICNNCYIGHETVNEDSDYFPKHIKDLLDEKSQPYEHTLI